MDAGLGSIESYTTRFSTKDGFCERLLSCVVMKGTMPSFSSFSGSGYGGHVHRWRGGG